MKTLGMRHIAINVKNAKLSKEFYCKALNMQVEWEPDPENIYLTSVDDLGPGLDNLALHQTAEPVPHFGHLHHLGFFVPTLSEVDLWYKHIQACGAKILKEIKTHRDGARSFYFADPDGIVIQILYHIPVAERRALPAESDSSTR